MIGSCSNSTNHVCQEYFFRPGTPYSREVQHTTAKTTCTATWSDSGCATTDLIGWCSDSYTGYDSYSYTDAGPAASLEEACKTGLQGKWHPG